MLLFKKNQLLNFLKEQSIWNSTRSVSLQTKRESLLLWSFISIESFLFA